MINLHKKPLFRNDSLPLPPTTGVQKLADDVLDLFTEKINKIMVNLIPAQPRPNELKVH